MRALNPLLVIATVALALTPSWALAQDVVPSEAATTVTTLAGMIRWTGVAASAIVVACAWLLLRFLDGVVEKLGIAFAEYRLLFHKVGAFVHFGVYFATIMLSILYCLFTIVKIGNCRKP